MTSILKVDRIESRESGGNVTFGSPIDPDGFSSNYRPGEIVQVKYTQFTGTKSITGSTDMALTDLTVDITPTLTSSIIKIEAMVNGEWSEQDGATDSVWFFYRDDTKLSHAAASNRNVGILMGTSITYAIDNEDSTPEHAIYSYFDSPSSTSQITYKVGVNPRISRTWYLNRTVADTDANNYERGISLICVTEIAASS